MRMRWFLLILVALAASAPAGWAQDNSAADTGGKDEDSAAANEPDNAGETANENVDAKASGGGKTFPRYASVKKGDVNVRSGPGNQYPILWVYQRQGYPVQLLTRYDNYFKVRDAEGEEGWVYVGMVSARKTGLVGGKHPVALYRHDDSSSDVVARVAPGVVVTLDDSDGCTTPYCKVDADGTRGWVAKAALLMVDQ